MATVGRFRAELAVLLEEQQHFLARSAQAFDDGYEAEAKRLATVLRVLLHDTAGSKSLLGQLGLKEQLAYCNTAPPIDPANVLPTSGLAAMQIGGGSGSHWVAWLGNLPPPRLLPDTTFFPWWTDKVTKDSDGVLWSRQDFVLALANQDGGAHVDPNLTAKYVRLSKDNSMGWNYIDPKGRQPLSNSPVLASVRQIVYELDQTLRRRAQLLVP